MKELKHLESKIIKFNVQDIEQLSNILESYKGSKERQFADELYSLLSE